MNKTVFKGSAVAIVTPFNDDLSINYDMMGKLIEFQISNGTDCIVCCATTGESPTLKHDEHMELAKYVIDKVNGRVPVVVSTGSNDTEHSIDFSVKAEKLGANALLSVTPYYNKTSQKGLVYHYKAIADKVNIPIILYNVPSRTGVNILPATYKELSKIDNICGIKEANGDISSVAKTMSLCENDIDIYSGNDDQIVPIMSLGGKGVISAFANICPKVAHELAFAMLNKDYDKATKLQLEYYDLMEALFCDVNPIPLKEALKMMGLDCGNCRLPLVCMDDDKKSYLKEILKKHNLI